MKKPELGIVDKPCMTMGEIWICFNMAALIAFRNDRLGSMP